jgi:uncharacterized protein (DUF4415 family)
MRKFRPNTPAEEAAIQRGIAADSDNPEWTDADFARARSAAEVAPQLVRRRGPQKTPTKEAVSLRLDHDLVERLRATGPGWQRRVNDTLRKAVMGAK